MAQLRPKIVKLAKIIGGVTGITTKIDENAPEYYCMASILTDEEADVAIAAGLRRERTAAYLAKKVGKTVQEVQPLLDNLVYYGIFRRSRNETLGEDTYYMQIFAPGILEMMVNQQDLLETHPEVGRAFEEYTRNLAANMGAMIPDGYGLMRVIPVESALEGIPGVNEFERISHYLDKYDRFSVSPCSCRASRTSIGDGCGHLDEDMCIQMGKGAEHYIRSGRAREITREQALEIIKRAEENGLMHDMVNIEEPGESAAICNCCACHGFACKSYSTACNLFCNRRFILVKLNDRGNCFYIFIFDDVQQSVKYILRRFTCRYTVPGCAHTFHIFPAHKIGVVFTCFRVQSILICQCTTTIRTFQQTGQPMLVNIRSLSVSHSGSNFCISFLRCIPQLLINEWLMFSVSDNFFSYSWRSTSATCTVPTDFSNIKRILKHISNIASFPALSSSCAITQVVNGRCDFCHRYMFDCKHVKASLNHRTIIFIDLWDGIRSPFFGISNRHI